MNFGQGTNGGVQWHRNFYKQKSNCRNFSTNSPEDYQSTMAPRQGSNSGYQTQNRILTGLKNFVNGLIYPALNHNIYSNYHGYYNSKNKNTCMQEKRKVHPVSIYVDLGMQACSIKDTMGPATGGNQMDKNDDFVAIFTPEDFPELPPPKKCTWKPQPQEKRSCLLNCTKSTKEELVPDKLDCDSEDGFILFADDCPPKCSTSINKSVECKPFQPRQRQISECSDDSFVICFTEDAAEGVIEFSDFVADSVSSDGSDNEDEPCQGFGKKTEHSMYPEELNQIDSGFDEHKEKKVRFDPVPKVHMMHVWPYAYQAARKGQWENFARDRQRFKHRIENLSEILSPILNSGHREKIYRTRFCDNTIIN